MLHSNRVLETVPGHTDPTFNYLIDVVNAETEFFLHLSMSLRGIFGPWTLMDGLSDVGHPMPSLTSHLLYLLVDALRHLFQDWGGGTAYQLWILKEKQTKPSIHVSFNDIQWFNHNHIC